MSTPAASLPAYPHRRRFCPKNWVCGFAGLDVYVIDGHVWAVNHLNKNTVEIIADGTDLTTVLDDAAYKRALAR